ncbi:MAG: hypothetical protein OFPI_00490 [Osedax symbiont Rs2]|nr:MAG: hypothetical protein OFPI_00490 [Osedax symbiont Rs2]
MAYSIVVIIPMYNSENTIERALSSIAKQTVQADRVIVIDDGSTDSSCEMVRKHSKSKLISIDLISQKNSGPSAARNKGIESTTEDLVCFLDADDEWFSTKLEKQVALYTNLILRKRKIGIIECFSQDISGEVSIIRNSPILKGKHFKDFLLRNVIKATSCVMIPREVLNDVGGFNHNLKFSEDRMLWSIIAERYEIYTVEEVLINRYFGHAGNITSNPAVNYIYKKQFSRLFVDKFQSILSDSEITKFQILNINEFLTAFYRRKNYKKAIECYHDMLKISISTIWVARFYPTIKFLISVIKLGINGKYNE